MFKGKYKEGEKAEPATWKTRLRCALNKSPDFEEVTERSQLDISEPYKVYRIVPEEEQKSEFVWACVLLSAPVGDWCPLNEPSCPHLPSDGKSAVMAMAATASGGNIAEMDCDCSPAELEELIKEVRRPPPPILLQPPLPHTHLSSSPGTWHFPPSFHLYPVAGGRL